MANLHDLWTVLLAPILDQANCGESRLMKGAFPCQPGESFALLEDRVGPCFFSPRMLVSPPPPPERPAAVMQ
jgi:hypothetical protein